MRCRSYAGRRARGPLRWPVALVGAAVVLVAQATGAVAQPDAPATERSTPPLFSTTDPLDLRITADFRALQGDRRDSPDRAALLTVAAGDRTVDVGASVRTRGAFRLDPGNCSFPPLRLDVRGSDAVGTVLEGQDDLKLVSSCRPGRSAYDDLVWLEYFVYRSYARLTDDAFQVRLVRLTFVDTAEELPRETRMGFLIENADALAERRGARLFELEEGKNLPPDAFEPIARARNAVFQYMIGNTDWSEVAAHNVEILELNGGATVVPYDFDFSGLVDAPYSVPAADLNLSNVRERLYRGWCVNAFTVRAVLDGFREARSDILTLWAGAVELDERTRRRAAAYLEDFFGAIETDERAERRFLRHCREMPG